MTQRRSRRWLPVLAAGAFLMMSALAAPTAAQAQVVYPGAPGESSLTLDRPQAVQRVAEVDADVRFMQDMILHHAQALEMTSLAPARASRADVRALARRIEASQADDIALMRRWLEERGQEAPELDAPQHAHHHHHHHDMPGMLTPEQLGALAESTGEDFDGLFLELMIHHHEGALVMVEELFAAGGGQDSAVFRFASHTDAEQRAEIARMRHMLVSPDHL